MLASRGLITALRRPVLIRFAHPFGAACRQSISAALRFRRLPAAGGVHNALSQELLQQRKNAAIRDLFADAGQQLILRDAVEISFDVGVHHPGVSSIQQGFDARSRMLFCSSFTFLASFPPRSLPASTLL
jgi:hypothetical protein